VASDDGAGIHGLAQAVRDGDSTAKRLGLGLSSAKRLVDEFDIESRVGVGTAIVMKKGAQ
jgi:serine/threonine-protein kinase RsbT